MGSNLGVSVCAPNENGKGTGIPPHSPYEVRPIPSPNTLRSEGDIKTAQLCFAAARGEVKTLEKLLQKKASVNAVDYDMRSALHVAAENEQAEVVAYLLEHGAQAELEDKWGQTPADCTSDPNVQKILRKGPRKDSNFGQEPHSPHVKHDDMISLKLCNAVAAGDLALCVSFLQRRADLNSCDYDGRTPAHIAASYGRNDVIQWLAEHHADLNYVDHFGLTALGDAQRRGHSETAELLEQLGSSQPLVINDFEAQPWAIPSAEVKIGDAISSTTKSTVHHATWRGTHVVVKVLKKDDVVESQNCEKGKQSSFARNELLHEIIVLSKLRHPDLLMCLGASVDHHEGTFVVLEYLQGGDLDDYYAKKYAKSLKPYRPPIDTLLKWSCSVARALAFLHNCKKPIVHRDLKPLNLLLSLSLDIKVADFGISMLLEPVGLLPESPNLGPKAHASEPSRMGSKTIKRTEPLRGVGTFRYMAPEVVRSEPLSESVDIYSFAFVMYFMATGLAPFADKYADVKDAMREYLKGNEPRPTFVPSTANTTYWKLMQDAWNEKPASRPSAYECSQRLAAMNEEVGGKKKKSFATEFIRNISS